MLRCSLPRRCPRRKLNFMYIAKKIMAAAIAALMVLMLSCCAAEHAQMQAEEPPKASSTPSPTPTPTPSPTPTPKPISPEVQALMGQNAQTALEKNRREYMTGRLVIPSAAVDVALFSDGVGEDEAQIRQAICDAEDSAAIYSDGIGIVIADHNNQAFQFLSEVQPGDRAYILRGESILSLECEVTFDGLNSGMGVTDADGIPATFYAEYICYTCGTDWTNVKIVGFRVIDEDIF